jgi:hypothetical protein
VTGQAELRFDDRPREIETAGPTTMATLASIEAAGGIIYTMERIPKKGNAAWRLRIRWPEPTPRPAPH